MPETTEVSTPGYFSRNGRPQHILENRQPVTKLLAQATSLSSSQSSQFLSRSIMLAQDRVRALEQLFPCFSKNYPARCTHEELRAQLDLKLLDLHADRCLRHVNARGARREGARLGDGHECP